MVYGSLIFRESFGALLLFDCKTPKNEETKREEMRSFLRALGALFRDLGALSVVERSGASLATTWRRFAKVIS